MDRGTQPSPTERLDQGHELDPAKKYIVIQPNALSPLKSGSLFSIIKCHLCFNNGK